MDLEILDELKKKYKNLYIDVKWVDFRKYKIEVRALDEYTEGFDFIYIYNVNFTKEYNMSIICYNIDKKIVEMYKREVTNE